MRVLTVHQPWAVAIIAGVKTLENRSWAPGSALSIGERFGIHVAMTRPSPDAVAFVLGCHPALASRVNDVSLRGHIIGSVAFRGVVESSDDPWFIGPLAWRLSDPWEWRCPQPAKGRLGLWKGGEQP